MSIGKLEREDGVGVFDSTIDQNISPHTKNPTPPTTTDDAPSNINSLMPLLPKHTALQRSQYQLIMALQKPLA
jgi:hypothetical protein